MKVKVAVLQFTRELNYSNTLEKAKKLLEKAEKPDFALIGGEFSVNESKNTDPYPALIELATSFNCNIVASVLPHNGIFYRSLCGDDIRW